MKRVDINCDLGESFGAWRMGRDAELLPHITSANIACGWHAGDPAVMRETVTAAVAHDVAIGAHPGLPDLAGFGRRAMAITPQQAHDLIVYQVGALQAIARTCGARVMHVKPHGALYNMAAADAVLADAIARAVRDVDDTLTLFGLSGSALIDAAERAGIPSAAEVFADRNYEADGSLTPRTEEDALIEDADVAAQRAVRMVTDGLVRTRTGDDIALRADTICIHGDGAHAVEIARALRAALEAADITITAPGAA